MVKPSSVIPGSCFGCQGPALSFCPLRGIGGLQAVFPSPPLQTVLGPPVATTVQAASLSPHSKATGGALEGVQGCMKP